MFRNAARVVAVALMLSAPGHSRPVKLARAPFHLVQEAPVPVTNGSSVEQLQSQPSLPTTSLETPLQLLEKSSTCFRPQWQYYFENVYDIYFIQVGAGCGTNACELCGESLWSYQAKFQWRGAVVEPNPVSYSELQSNYADYTNVRPLKLAISDIDNDAIDFWCNDAYNRCTTNKHFGQSFPARIKVPSRTLAGLWDELQPSQVDLLVIDVEDAEDRVLPYHLPEPRPRMILYNAASFMDKDIDPNGQKSLADIRRRITDEGYRPLYLGKDKSHPDDLWELKGARKVGREVLWKP